MTARAVPPFSPQVLAASLEALAAPPGGLVALSGGADSAALLVAASRLTGERFGRVGALHIDHGLPGSPALRVAAAAAAAACGVDLSVVRVDLQPFRHLGPEAAARAARTGAFAAALAPGRALLLAHHEDDQAETVLLQLLRGAGARGLAGMPASAPLGAGRALRPLLGVPKLALRQYAADSGVPWVEDPSNADASIARNYVRAALWPPLALRWPAAARTLARAAGHLADTVALLDEELARRLADLESDGGLHLARLAEQSPAWRREVLRYWLHRQGVPLPSTRRLAEIEGQFLTADPDRHPKFGWAGIELRRHDGILYAVPPLPSLPTAWPAGLAAGRCIDLPGLGTLRVTAATASATTEALRVGPDYALTARRGGERWRAAPHAAVRPLKDCLREARVPVWQRRRLVCVMDDECLAAVILPGGFWVAADYRAATGEAGLSVAWCDAPTGLRGRPGRP